MSREIILIDDYCTVTHTSLKFKRDVTKAEWQKVFNTCSHIEGCIQFWIGDLLVYKEQKWGMYDDIAEKTGIPIETIKQYKQVADQIKSGDRSPHLTWTHHLQVAGLPESERKDLLEKAEKGNLSIRELRQEAKKIKHADKTAKPLPEKKYEVIYADPPWAYDTPQSSVEVEDHYPTMGLEELKDYPVGKLAWKDSVLYMWATTARLNWAIPVMEAWGFKYKTSMVWDKVKHNMGFYCSARHEFLLIGGRGVSKPENQKLANSIDSVQVIEKAAKHSEKPIEFYEIIEKLYSNKKKAELFQRKPRERWDGYGNEL